MSVINVPKYYKNDYGVIKTAGEYIKEFGNNVLTIGGKTALNSVRADLYKSLDENKIKYEEKLFIGYPTQEKILNLSRLVEKNNNDAIIGIGGGKVLDLAKAVGDKKDIPIITIPTIPATCAAWSALSVIYKDNGEQDAYIYLKNPPSLILADKDVLLKAPIRYLNSGVADTIAKWYEIHPDLRNNKDNFALRLQLKICELALEFLQKDYIEAVKNNTLFENKIVIENAIDSIIMLAGLSGSINGSVPYGGLAHPFYNNSTKIQETHELLHGEKVIFGLLVQLVLENRKEEEILEFIDSINVLNLPTTLKELGIKGNNCSRKVEFIANEIKESVGNYSGLNYELKVQDIVKAIYKVNELGIISSNKEVKKMPNLSNKVEKFSESKIRQMTILSNAYNADNLAQGFPEFDPPKELTKALEKAAKNGPHQYAPSWGAENFKEAIAEKEETSLKRKIDPTYEVLVTCGSTEAMISVMLTVFNPGDKVIIFSPYYTSYVSDSILAQVEPIFVSLKAPSFEFDIEELEEAFKQKPKAIILCNPSNPCGKVFTRKELLKIAQLAEKYDSFVITDEVYEHIIYKPYEHISFASLPRMFERTITCSSLSKTYSITGWRLGYVVAPKSIIENVRKVHDFLTVAAASPLQEAAIAGLKFNKEYYDELQKIYTEKKEFFLNGLDEIGFKHNNPQGTYFVLLDISEFGFKSDVKFCEYLVKKYKIGAVPGSSFFHDKNNNWIRLHFAKNRETLERVLRRLKELKNNFRGSEQYDKA